MNRTFRWDRFKTMWKTIGITAIVFGSLVGIPLVVGFVVDNYVFKQSYAGNMWLDGLPFAVVLVMSIVVIWRTIDWLTEPKKE